MSRFLSGAVRRRLALPGLLCALGLFWTVPAAAESCVWPDWQRFTKVMISPEGQVIDRSLAQTETTAESQAHALFFALVNNEPARFRRILGWTEENLAAGDLRTRLPASLWTHDANRAEPYLEEGSASHADLWFAYSLLEASRLWGVAEYRELGLKILALTEQELLSDMPSLGTVVLPSQAGSEDVSGWRLKPGDMPLQLLDRFAAESPLWAQVAKNTRNLLLASAPQGFAPDGLVWHYSGNPLPDSRERAEGDLDAIRVYLWLGMLHPDALGRELLQKHYAPIVQLTASAGAPPERVDALTGEAEGAAGPESSAALLPLIHALDQRALNRQRARLVAGTAANESPALHALRLFGRGWDEGRFRFGKDGRLVPAWQSRVCLGPQTVENEQQHAGTDQAAADKS